MECCLQRGVAATERVHAESGEKVEVAVALSIEKVRALTSNVETIESNGLEHPCQLVVQVLVVDLVVFTVARP